jgi:hypothetical protein
LDLWSLVRVTDDNGDWIRYLLSAAAVTQLAEARMLAPILAESAGALSATSDHPEAGQRTVAHQMSGAAGVFVASGDEPCAWSQSELEQVLEQCSKITRCGEDIEDGCGARQPSKYKDEDICRIFAEWKDIELPEGMAAAEAGTSIKDGVIERYLEPEYVYRLLRRIGDEDVDFMGFSRFWCRPDWMMCTVLPVPPPQVRPSVLQDNNQRSEDDLTQKLIDIIKTNKRGIRVVRLQPAYRGRRDVGTCVGKTRMAKQFWQLRQPVTASAAEFEDLQVAARRNIASSRLQCGLECLASKAVKIICLDRTGTASNRPDAATLVHQLVVNNRVRILPEF